MASKTGKALVVPIQGFAREIIDDLPRLYQESPNGINIQRLHEYYGEQPARIMKAISLLEERKVITVYRAQNHSHYILPSNVEHGALSALSALQRSTLTFVQETCKTANTTQLRTDYAQLARIQKCSTGGIRSCIDRLVKLRYLRVLNPSRSGKQSDLLLELVIKGTPNNEDQDLTS